MLPMVYVAGPYTRPDPVTNTRTAVLFAEALYATGLCVPFVPHLSMLWHTISPHDTDYWYDLDLKQMAHCDAVIRLTGESTGADAEIEEAKVMRIPYIGVTLKTPDAPFVDPTLLNWLKSVSVRLEPSEPAPEPEPERRTGVFTTPFFTDYIASPPATDFHRVQISTEHAEHWICSCDGWQLRSDKVFTEQEYLAARASHALHTEARSS